MSQKLRPARGHPLWIAFILHRLSGMLLALFLPLHFLALALVLESPAALDSFLRFTDFALVKTAEFGLVSLLAIHVFGGMRLMALEWLAPLTGMHSHRQKTLAAAATALGVLLGGCFLLQLI